MSTTDSSSIDASERSGLTAPDTSQVVSAEQAFSVLSQQLLAVARPAVGPWVEHQISSRLPPAQQIDLADLIESVVLEASAEVGARLDLLLCADAADQRSNPLSVLRSAVPFVTRALIAAGIDPVRRDDDARAMHPEDLYDVTPGAFSDFGQEVHDAGMMWGAAKAHLHLRRRAALEQSAS